MGHWLQALDQACFIPLFSCSFSWRCKNISFQTSKEKTKDLLVPDLYRSMQKNWCFFLGFLLSNYSRLGSMIKIHPLDESRGGTIYVMESQPHPIGKNNKQLSQRVCGPRDSGKGLFSKSVPHNERECSSVSSCPPRPSSLCRWDLCWRFCFLFKMQEKKILSVFYHNPPNVTY